MAQEVSGITFNPITNQFLVVWSDGRGGWDVYGRLVNVDGTMPGGEINFTADPSYQGQPTVAHDWRTNTYLVAYIADVTSTISGTFAKVVNSAGQPITGAITLDAGGYQDLPSAMYLPEPGRFLVVWRATPTGTVTDVMGRLVQPDGIVAGNVYPVIATSPVRRGARRPLQLGEPQRPGRRPARLRLHRRRAARCVRDTPGAVDAAVDGPRRHREAARSGRTSPRAQVVSSASAT